MSRRKAAQKREVLPDPKFGSETVAKFINCVMLNGKKSTAEQIVYGAFEVIAERLNIKDKMITVNVNDESDGGDEGGSTTIGTACPAIIDAFDKILDSVRPTVEVRSRRVGGATYQIPVEVRSDRSLALAMRWLINAARDRGEKGFGLRLAGEMLDAYEGKGSAVKKREDTHRMAKANQAFAHYRW